MVRTQIQLTQDQSERLKRSARKRRMSMAALIREAVDEALNRDEETRDYDERMARATAAIGCLNSGLGDLAERHDDYLAEAYLK